MGKASRRKRQLRTGEHHDRVRAAGEVPAPNVEGAALDAARHAMAMVTAAHASPEDLPRLAKDLSGNRARQGMVAYALVSRFIMEGIRELADAHGVLPTAALEDVITGPGLPANQPALDRARATARTYAEVLGGMQPPEAMVADLDSNVAEEQHALGYLTALACIADQAITARCTETGENVTTYLQRIALPAAEAHGNDIDANVLEDYVGTLLAARLDAEPALLDHAALALRNGSTALDEEVTDEFRELGGSARLEELTGARWDALDDEDQRLIVLTMIESVFVDPEGDTVADRIRIVWRF